MRTTLYARSIFVLALAGTAFAGYLTLAKLISGNCALGETCPYFLGYPACWYGLGMFATMLILSLIAIARDTLTRHLAKAIAVISGVGIVFAGSFVWGEMYTWFTSVTDYTLILPSCVYGLVFYMAIFVLTLIVLLRKPNKPTPLVM